MFTGIIEEIGTVSELIKANKSMRIGINATKILDGTNIGDSIAVNGICMTVTKLTNKSFFADLSPETIEKTSLNFYRIGDFVNLERALTPVSRIGGHFVMGHIDGTGIIDSITDEKGFWKYKIKTDPHLMLYIASKGSVGIDGVSLTPYDCTKDDFIVMIIPHTLDSTTLKLRHEGDKVNVECDVLSKYVKRLIEYEGLNMSDEEKSRKIDTEYLRKTGFLI
jgi:riboflavin synthase